MRAGSSRRPCSARPNAVPRDVAQPDEHQDGDDQRHVVQPGGVLAGVADERGQIDVVDAAEARELRDLREEVVDEHREGQGDHQEVDADAARGDRAEGEPDGGGDRGSRRGRRARAPTRPRPAVRGDEVRERHAGYAVDPDLRERHHAAVRRQEDEAGRGHAEPQRLGEDDRQEEVGEDERRERRQAATTRRARARSCARWTAVTPASRTDPAAAPRARPRAGRRSPGSSSWSDPCRRTRDRRPRRRRPARAPARRSPRRRASPSRR